MLDMDKSPVDYTSISKPRDNQAEKGGLEGVSPRAYGVYKNKNCSQNLHQAQYVRIYSLCGAINYTHSGV